MVCHLWNLSHHWNDLLLHHTGSLCLCQQELLSLQMLQLQDITQSWSESRAFPQTQWISTFNTKSQIFISDTYYEYSYPKKSDSYLIEPLNSNNHISNIYLILCGLFNALDIINCRKCRISWIIDCLKSFFTLGWSTLRRQRHHFELVQLLIYNIYKLFSFLHLSSLLKRYLLRLWSFQIFSKQS